MVQRRVVLTRPAYTREQVTRRVAVPSVTSRVEEKTQSRGLGGEEYGTPFGVPSSPHVSPGECRKEKKESNVASLLEQANSLTAAQRQELLDNLALNNQLTHKAATNRDLDMWAEAVAIALDEVVGSNTGEGGGSYGSLLVKRSLGSSACWRPIEAFMEKSKLRSLMVNERQAIYLLLARLLVEHCKERCRYVGAPLSLKFVSQQTSSVAGVFEQSFPGYLAAGLAPMVAKQMQALG